MTALARSDLAALARIPADPPSALAGALLRTLPAERAALLVADNERRAEDLQALLQAMAPERDAMLFPPWDCLPHDRLCPSAAVMGRRAAVLARLGRSDGLPVLVVATPEALAQRVPWPFPESLAPLRLAVGDPLDEATFVQDLLARGYWSDERVDEPGEFSPRGSTFDLFPADAREPVRIAHENGRITSLRSYDAATQRSTAELQACLVAAARETPAGAGRDHPGSWTGPRRLLPEIVPDALLVLDRKARDRALGFLEMAAEAREALRARPGRQRTMHAADLYADGDAIDAMLGGRATLRVADELAPAIPHFARQRHPEEGFARFCASAFDEGQRVVLSGMEERALARASRAAARALGHSVPRARTWQDALATPPGTAAGVLLPAAQGFRDEEGGFCLVTAQDLIGSRALPVQAARHPFELDPDWRIGDAVVHLEHGIAFLQGLERIQGEDGSVCELFRLAFANDEMLLVPAHEAGLLWRYGSAGTPVKPDPLNGSAWQARRERVAAEIVGTARRLADLAAQRRRLRASVIDPPAVAYERLAGRFPYVETPDQATAIAETLADLRSGRPMDRLICGDVGFGKTEVALRAAAAVALSGRQVVLAAPTTVLARQHAETFRRRFRGFGIAIAELSRFVPAAQARAVKEGLANGDIRIVIGTHAVAGKGVRFHDLGLVVIDEEQRFGERHKAALRALARDEHVLVMTATPIPRTLQSAMAGLRDISIIATPPVARRPVRTSLEAFSPEILVDALLREKGRGGQSFVVCPRVEDLPGMERHIRGACPELDLITVHAKLPATQIDEAMLRFADGEADCLLATNIVESGLDVPNANTMVIWRPDRFGLAQLHQLRGRVGRGRATGICLMLTPDGAALKGAARRRLQTLVALDRPGAGFAISAQDLDQRGAGDLFGEDQTGHVSMIGAGLARHLAEQALRRARGEEVEEDWTPDIAIADRGHVPADYVPEDEARLNLYVRLGRAAHAADLASIADEIEDRFGDPPAPVTRLLAVAGLAVRARALGIARLDAGPHGVAAGFRTGGLRPPAWLGERERLFGGAPLAWRHGKAVWSRAGEPHTDVARAEALLAALEHLAETAG